MLVQLIQRKTMKAYFTLSHFACCIVLIAIGSLAHGQDLSVSTAGDKTGRQSSSMVITPPNDRPLVPVPEPSAGSLILLGLGSVGLAMKLRKQA